tara:strand:- start:76 stop:630 length:555 start_codon:yes stop_codon:yes gene_type:complete
MNFSNPIQIVIPLKVLRQTKKFAFQYTSNLKALTELTRILKIEELKAFSFQGQIFQLNEHDYTLRASFDATVVQLCIISLNPIKTKISNKINQSYIDQENSQKTKYLLIDHDSIEKEQFKSEINVGDIMLEALSLEIPLYPRKKNAKFEGITVTDSEIKPLDRTTNNPFLSLKELKLRNKLKKN